MAANPDLWVGGKTYFSNIRLILKQLKQFPASY